MAALVQFSWGYLHTHAHTVTSPLLRIQLWWREKRNGGAEEGGKGGFSWDTFCQVLGDENRRRFETSHKTLPHYFVNSFTDTENIVLFSALPLLIAAPPWIPHSWFPSLFWVSYPSLTLSFLSLHPPPLSLTITPSTFSYPSPSVHPSLSTSQLTSLSLLFPSLTSLSLLFSSSLSPWQRQLCLGSRSLVIQNNTF